MKKADLLRLSATDLANHLACRHLTFLDRELAEGRIAAPRGHRPGVDVLQQRGMEHERAYLEVLEDQGLEIVRLDGADTQGELFRRSTTDAMRGGADVIVQGTLESGRWVGRPDVLRRVETPSDLGGWSYEVYDTKLAHETRGGTILQLCLYSDLVREIQGRLPESMHVVSPGKLHEPARFRTDGYMAYYRRVRRRLEAAVDAEATVMATYPEPVPHCDVCRWWPTCDHRRRADDHPSLVAGISRLQTRELAEHDVVTLESLATHPLPIAWTPRRGSRDAYARVREQARVQLAGRQTGEPVRELLQPIEEGRGLARLPAPSTNDLFFDLEGDPFIADGGREYLFGWTWQDATGRACYDSAWALTADEERKAFEGFVDRVMAQWAADPTMHVYHFAPYEPGALKRLMGRYATREAEIDRMLRGGLFVDLLAVVRQGLRASIESYSIKKLEIFYDFHREMPLDALATVKQTAERCLELERAGEITAAMKDAIEAYNRDDCVSTLRLRDWLESLRSDLERDGEVVPRPAVLDAAPSDSVSDREARERALVERLESGLPADAAARTRDESAQWLLAQLLGWHRREEKAQWWEYYRLLELDDDELVDEKSALGGLEWVERVEDGKRPVDRYRFPRQETSLRAGKKVNAGEKKFGEIAAIDLAGHTVDIKKHGTVVDVHPHGVFEHDLYQAFAQAESLMRLGHWVADHGVDATGAHRAARDLLLSLAPRLSVPAKGRALERLGEDALAAAKRLVGALDRGVLAIQGPPGSGKTYTGARVIVSLLQAGLRVGVTGPSHKVIRNLLEEVVEAAGEAGFAARVLQKIKEDEHGDDARIEETDDNATAKAALDRGEPMVVGGTTYLWARSEYTASVDVLVVDEAGQLSLANALAVAPAGGSLVLLGDPRQLEQPVQGSHPDGAGISALEHVLQGRATLPPERGLFLAETWRLHPEICAFTSGSFYEGRLRSRAGLDAQSLAGCDPFGVGLWFVPAEHVGNQSACTEEIALVERIVSLLTAPGATWVDRHGERRPLTLDDVLVIAPYNAQVADLRVKMPGLRVGTVDKFQGQEAPAVVYSLTTSSAEEAPRGMEFLYALDRFNVATSRARCATIVVGCPRLLEPECRTPRQIELANAMCLYHEMAKEIRIE